MNTWGGNAKDMLFYSDYTKSNVRVPVIKVSSDRSYGSNEIKHVNIINQLLAAELEYDWYYFGDDDTFVNTDLLFSELPSFDRQKTYGQIIYCWPKDSNLGYFSGGAGWLISNEIMPLLRPVINHKTGYSDVTLGINMKDRGIPMVDDCRFKSQLPWHYGMPNEDVKNFITFHGAISSIDMHTLYNAAPGTTYNP
jgi:hypothetical protein